jgi:hypothetical protein
MAILDFIKNRQSQQQTPSEQPKPETAKEMYTREASQDKANAKSLDQMTATGKARASDIRDDLQNSIKPAASQEAVISSPTDGDAAPHAVRQNMNNQDKAAPSLSPTSEQMGKTSADKEVAAPSQARPQTIARPSPSWER